MRIKSIYIENFRSLEKVHLNLTGLDALVGPNNAGKSNILLALKKVLYGWLKVSNFTEDDFFAQDTSRDIIIAIHLNEPISYSKYKGGQAVDVFSIVYKVTHYKIGEQKGNLRLDVQCLDASGSIIYVPQKAPKKGFEIKMEPLIGLPNEIKSEIPLIYIDIDRNLNAQLPSEKYSLLRKLLDDVNKDFSSPENLIKNEDGTEKSRLKVFKNLMQQAFEILRTEKFNQLEKIIKDNTLQHMGLNPETEAEKLNFKFTFPDTEDFYKNLNLEITENGLGFNVQNMGQGIQNAIVVSIFKAYEELRASGALILIEEPEMYLHPHKQRGFYNLLKNISTSNQIIYTTHSSYFVNLPEYERVHIIKKHKLSTSIHESKLKLNGTETERIKKEFDATRNELFFAQKVILVEGDTDRMVLEEYAKRLGIDLNHNSISIIGAGGKRSIPLYVKILKSFDIPTFVLYDIDSTDFDKHSKQDEAEFNRELNSMADSNTLIFSCDPKIEIEIRETCGEEVYMKLCQTYAGYKKAIKHKLIAADEHSTIPKKLSDLLEIIISFTPIIEDKEVEEGADTEQEANISEIAEEVFSVEDEDQIKLEDLPF